MTVSRLPALIDQPQVSIPSANERIAPTRDAQSDPINGLPPASSPEASYTSASPTALTNSSVGPKQGTRPPCGNCHNNEIMDRLPKFTGSPFFFVNLNGRLDGKHYPHDFLVDLWNEACKKVGEKIPMYAGLKHSSCSQYINQKGLDHTQLKLLSQHAGFESLSKYVRVEPETIRSLMTAKIIDWGKFGERKEGRNQ